MNKQLRKFRRQIFFLLEIIEYKQDNKQSYKLQCRNKLPLKKNHLEHLHIKNAALFMLFMIKIKKRMSRKCVN
jgi:hypothetical protein